MMDLLDALHYLFEEDQNLASGEQQEARDKLRVRIYTDLYERPKYEWIVKQQGTTPETAAGHAAADMDTVKPDAGGLTHHGYIPPTEFDPAADKPFGDVLDAPLG